MAEKYIPYNGSASPGDFQDGAIIDSSHFTNEFDQLGLVFDGSTGHNHDGQAGSGPKIDTSGLALNAVDSTILDETDSSYVVAGMTINSLTVTSGTAVTSIDTDLSSVSATDNSLASAKAIKAYVDTQVTASDLDFQGDSGGALSIDLDSETLTIAGGTGLTTTGSGNTLTVDIDSTVATLTGTQTLTNKTLSSPVITGNLTTNGNIDGRDVATDGTKLDGIETGATADQTAAEIKTAYESNSDTNAFTDAEQTKLSGIEAGADVTDSTNVTAAGALMDSEVTNLAQVKAFSSADYATAAQGTLADSAVQPSDNISVLTNNSGYITGNQTITLSGDATGSGTTAITVALANNTVGVNELNLTDGTAGQFLKTNGAGTISFADAPTQATSFTVLDVDNINIDGNTISSTDSEGAVIIQPSSGGDVTLDVTSNASYTEESPILQGHVLVDSTMNLGLNSYQSPTTFYRRTYDTRPSGNQFVPSGQLVFQTYNASRSATTMDSATIEAQQYYSSSGNDYGTLTISTNYFNGVSETKLSQVEFRSEGPSNATKREAAFLGKVIVAGETTTGLDVQNGNIKVASGHGIDFSSDANASGMTSELLDDYEEGTWTPTLTTTGTDFGSVNHNASRSGTYTKIGRQVTVHCFLAWNNITFGAASGDLAVGGLPFTKGTSATQIGPAYGYLRVSSPFNNPTLAGALNGNTKAVLYKNDQGNEFGVDTITPNTIDSSATLKYIQMTLTYEV